MTDDEILEKALVLGRGGSTAVTGILINGEKLVIANVGDSRAVMCKNGVAKQLSIDHEPSKEKRLIESRGGFVTNLPGNQLSEVITTEKRFCVYLVIDENSGLRSSKISVIHICFNQ